MSAPAAPALPPAVQAKLDPYLLSALLSQFAHYDDHADGGSTPLVSVGFTVALPATGLTAASVQATLVGWLAEHAGARITEAHLLPLAHDARAAYVTADVSPALLLLLGAAPFVAELQLCANPLPRRPLPARPATPASPAAAPLRTANKKILATIDHGCAFAHQLLQNAGGTRVWALWDQDPRPDYDPAQGSTPVGYGYGRQVGRDVQNACVAPQPPVAGWNEDRCYARARYGDQYDPTSGVLAYREPRDRLRDGVAGLTEQVLRNPDAAFFASANPGHELGHDIHLGIGHVERAAHVADDGARRHRPERHDLGDVVVAVFAADVVHNLAAARVAEIHVDIGHGHALRVQEALEIEAVLHRVDVRDVQAVRHH